MENVKITLVKSLIAALPAQKKTAKALGLTKIGDSKVLANTPATQGQIKVISHLVSVETVQ
ncbi:MAG: 50S ribosomal protein L30 [Eubacteriales bacterium]